MGIKNDITEEIHVRKIKSLEDQVFGLREKVYALHDENTKLKDENISLREMMNKDTYPSLNICIENPAHDLVEQYYDSLMEGSDNTVPPLSIQNIIPKEIHDGLLKYINETPALRSLLYDINLLPEQLLTDATTGEYLRMLTIAARWKEEH